MTFDRNASYEWLAEEFRKETGLMAPAKDDPLGSDMAERLNAWRKWFEARNEEAWREWHERHDMVAAHSAGAQASDSGSDSIAFDYAHKLLSERLGVQSKYDPCDPGNWRDGDDAMGNAAQPPSMTDAARDAHIDVLRDAATLIAKHAYPTPDKPNSAWETLQRLRAEIERLDRAKGK